MNNLLKTLTESNHKPPLAEADLKLLLSSVKDSRRQGLDPKIQDAFYDALEDLMHDLRTVTIDNHDAEPFLKPVARADAPDYYDVIPNPMDLQTMLKKVKQKQYKSKREFKDDLDLIWSNCSTYNAAENHPLRGCAKRLKAKADNLLKNITDRRDRLDPSVPPHLSIASSGSPSASRLSATPRPNGVTTNGRARASASRSPTLSSRPAPRQATSTPIPSPPKSKKPRSATASQAPKGPLAFPDMPAIVRTPEGMAAFADLDAELYRLNTTTSASHSSSTDALEERLRSILHHDGGSEDAEEEGFGGTIDRIAGEKRKMSPVDQRPRKRARLDVDEEESTLNDLWWKAVQENVLLGNAFPSLVHQSSPVPKSRWKKLKFVTGKGKERADAPTRPSLPQNALLNLMNANITTMKRVRNAHLKLGALQQQQQQQQQQANAGSDDGQGGGSAPAAAVDLTGLIVDDRVDERPWTAIAAGVEVGEENAAGCLHWMGKKVLEHAGFQGSSKMALDVLAGVTSEYLLNVGRTIRFLSDKFGGKMSAEEIILHTLFESGTTRIQDLERYIKDDVIRYGGRLTELEKKLNNAYSDATADEILDDDDLFNEDEEEDSAFVMGNFTDALGDDFLGLKELGIAEEFGLSSLSVPKKLLKSKNNGGTKSSAAAKPSEPPPPFPPPPPFVPLDSSRVDDQIGLLQPFYHTRLQQSPAAPQMQDSTSGGMFTVRVIPDEPPDPVHTKMGALGQIVKANAAPAGAASKKKGRTAGGGNNRDGVPNIPGAGILDDSIMAQMLRLE